MVPFLPGVVLGRLLWGRAEAFAGLGPWLSVVALCVGAVCVVAGACSFLRKGDRPVSHLFFGCSAFLFIFFFGVWRSFEAWRQVQGAEWPEGRFAFRAVLLETPKPSARTVGAEALLCGGGNRMGAGGRKVWLSFPRDSLSRALRVGDEVWCRAQVRKPVNRGNPEEFDYVEYLSVQGISGRAFVRRGDWAVRPGGGACVAGLPLWTAWRVGALQWREKVVEVYREAGLRGEDLEFFAALTLGDQSGLSDELKEVYAGVGVSHVLALSGMHLTFLMGMLNVLLLNYCRSRRWRAVGVVLALLLIWGYTFLSGLPPSLVRATVMYSLMLAGSLLGRAGFSINSLALAAMLMLCVDPLLSYDVGFQLSFLAMAGILALCPRFLDLPLARRPWVGWVVQSLLVSFAAQLFTIPLVAYRFGTFAPYSALATLLVSPVTALLIYGMPVLLFSALLGLGSEAVSAAIGFLEACQNGCLRLMMKWPGAVVHTDWGLCFTSLCYVALGVWVIQPFRYKAMRWKVGMAGAIGLFAAFHVCRWAGRVRPEVVFYNQPSCPAVHVIYSSSSSYLFTVARDSVRERMAYVAESFWQKKLTAAPLWVAGDFCDDAVAARQGLVRVRGGVSFLLLADNRWDGMAAKERADVDYLYVCRGFTGDLQSLSRLFRPRRVVLDASLWDSDRRRHAAVCRALGWPVYDMREEGALRIPLP